MAAEISSAGWRKPVGEAYPAPGLLAPVRCRRRVPLTTASDAHNEAQVADRSADLRRQLAELGWTACAPTVAGGRDVPVGVPARRRPWTTPADWPPSTPSWG